jgi:hypothetical protein
MDTDPNVSPTILALLCIFVFLVFVSVRSALDARKNLRKSNFILQKTADVLETTVALHKLLMEDAEDVKRGAEEVRSDTTDQSAHQLESGQRERTAERTAVEEAVRRSMANGVGMLQRRC